MTTRTETEPYGLLGSLSPELAKDLGDAFSLRTIGAAGTSPPKRGSVSTSRLVLRLAGRAAAFISVTAFAVLVTTTALYLMQL